MDGRDFFGKSMDHKGCIAVLNKNRKTTSKITVEAVSFFGMPLYLQIKNFLKLTIPEASHRGI